jgi:Flp pilus assembly pilin Flp
MTEYAIIVTLIAVGTIGVVGLFGDNLRTLFGASTDALAGQTSVQTGAKTTPAGLTKYSLKGRYDEEGGGTGGPGLGPEGPGLGSGGTGNSAPPGDDTGSGSLGPGGSTNAPVM